MKKVLSKSKNSTNQVPPNRHKELGSLPPKPDVIEKIRKAIEGHAERARINGFIQLGYLPYVFVHEKGYSDVLLHRLWEYFECDRVPKSRYSKTKYEMWFWIFRRWAGMPDDLWKSCSPVSHLPLLDSETRQLKKERYCGRKDADLVMLEDLKRGIEIIGKNLNIDFPLPALLFPDESDKRASFKHSPDFRSVNKDGQEFTLTPKQAQVIQKLFEGRERKTPDLGQSYIIEEVSPDTSTKRLRDLFKNDLRAWDALIERGSKKGTFRLKR